MSDLSELWLGVIPVAVLVASLTGSMHCVGMCGGLIASVARTPSEIARYHLGRLLGYAALGAGAGYLGSQVFATQGTTIWVSWLATSAIAATFIWMGIVTWKGRQPHIPGLPTRWIATLFERAGGSPFLTGSLSAFLPCGWLHSFVLAATATRSAWSGALFLLFFWLGTLPAMSLAPVLVTRVLKPVARKAPKFAAILLIAVGVFSLGFRARKMVLAPEQKACCHHSAGHSAEGNASHGASVGAEAE